MSYTTPITDRTQSDVTNKTSKAYLNVADWNRIYGNAQYVNGLFSHLGTSVSFPTISTPTTSSFPSVTDFNSLLASIENMRLALVAIGINISGLTTIFSSWVAGYSQDAPDYQDVNTWEQSIDLIYNFLNNAYRFPRTGVASCGSTMTWENRFRR